MSIHEIVLLGRNLLLLFCPIVARWIRSLVPGRPWAHASPRPFHNNVIIYCCSDVVDGYVLLLPVMSFCFPSACTIAGVSSVSRGCINVILIGCTTQEGAGASALAWAVHAIL